MERDMPTVWAIQLGAGLPFFWPAVRADNACAGADIVAPALRPLGFVLAEKGDGLPAARRLASPAGGGGTALAVTERAFSPHTIPHCCPLSRLRRQLSQRERQVGAFWLGTYVSGGFAVPHPSRLAASHLPLGGRVFGAVELGRCRGKPTLAAGAYPRKVRLLSPTY